jgi:hypothetical protein
MTRLIELFFHHSILHARRVSSNVCATLPDEPFKPEPTEYQRVFLFSKGFKSGKPGFVVGIFYSL